MTLDVTPLSGDKLPVRRSLSEFVVETLSDEVLVYDEVDHAAHCLSPAAALVWGLCDGRSTFDDAATALRASGHVEAVVAVVAQLTAARLVLPAPLAPASAALAPRRRRSVNHSRRAMLSRGAVVAGVVLASPVIFSIIAPSVAEAASTCGTIGNACCPVAPPLDCTDGSVCDANRCS